MIDRLGVGLAALGRPAYINLGREGALPATRSVEEMRAACWAVLDAAYAAGVRWIDVARSYGRSEEFLAGWLADRAHADVTVSSKWGYAYVGGWRLDAEVHEVKEHSLAQFTRQLAQTRGLLGVRLALYQVHSLTPDSPLFSDCHLRRPVGLLHVRPVAGGDHRPSARPGRRRTAPVHRRPVHLEPSAGPALAHAHAAGIHVLVKEALANGRLAVQPPPLITHLAAHHSVTPDAIALAAALAQPWADTVLLGPASVAQLHSNLAATALHLDTDLTTLAQPPPDYWAHRSTLPWT